MSITATPTSPPPSTSKPSTVAERIAKIKEMVSDLNDRYKDVQGDMSPEGLGIRARLTAQLRRLSHDQIHPDEDYVELDMPLSITGEPFRINEEVFAGVVQVPGCVAGVLLSMVEQNRKVEMDRMREGGRTINLNSLTERARVIQQD